MDWKEFFSFEERFIEYSIDKHLSRIYLEENSINRDKGFFIVSKEKYA